METERTSHWQALQPHLLEGYTQFLPVSSTGSLVLLCEAKALRKLHGAWSGVEARGIKTLELIIQVAAIVSVMVLDKNRMAQLAKRLFKKELVIGTRQYFALWSTISKVSRFNKLSIGINREVTAEFSFLIGLAVFIAAFISKLADDKEDLFNIIEVVPVLIGFLSAAFFAWISTQFLVRFLSAHALAVIGWYRIALSCFLLGTFFR